MKSINLFNTDNFLLSTRDSGYKNFSSAIAEILDNSFEAEAKSIEIFIDKEDNDYSVGILDDGSGMDNNIMTIALQFGGSTRFNSRVQTGRYGMGLPNSSLSHSRRVDVYSWKRKNEIWWSYLDLDEILKSKNSQLHIPDKINHDKFNFKIKSKSGTYIKWSKCDRLRYKHENKLLHDLHNNLGKLFRKKIWDGSTILINGDLVKAIDPTFVTQNINGSSALILGEPLKYNVKLENDTKQSSEVLVTFSKLPIENWYSLSNDEKQKFEITKHAGVSILRSGREIDNGWFFTGSKRKENYDDWWRCEISFEPYLDELFGVTHTKQEIHPTDQLLSILTPDIERIARELNRDVRERFIKIKQNQKKSVAENTAERFDYLLEPPKNIVRISNLKRIKSNKRKPLKGISYKIKTMKLDNFDLFQFDFDKQNIQVLLNERHPFYNKIYSEFNNSKNKTLRNFKEIIDLIIFGHVRAEISLHSLNTERLINTLRKEWSNNLANYLQSV